MYSACFLTKMLVAKLAHMSNFCLAISDAMWPVAQMATGSASMHWPRYAIVSSDVKVITQIFSVFNC